MTQEQQPIAPTLRQLAEAVKDWSNDNQAWLKPDCEDGIAVLGGIIDGEEYPIAEFDADTYGTDGESIKLAQFYAAASPTVVLDLLDHLADLEAQLAAQLAWMSIDTAPKDGTLILVKSAHDDYFPTVCYWYADFGYWKLTQCGSFASDDLVYPDPTLWTHMPTSAIALPQEKQEQKPLTDGDIVAAQERLIAAKDELYRSRIGLKCALCNTGQYRADGNGYHDFHRCDSCGHVPMWNADGREPWICLLCKSSRPGHHSTLDDRTTPCPNTGKT